LHSPLVNHYQPQVDFAVAEVFGVEALVRWRQPENGLVLPDQFLADVEASGLIGSLTQAVFENGLADARHWRKEGLGLRLSINVSSDDLEELEFPDRVARKAAVEGVAADRLVFEVTDGQATRDRTAMLNVATRLRLKQIHLSLDDFGTGYSSLARLRDVPFSELKLDRSFVHGACSGASLRAIFEANFGMAKQLGLRIDAKGAEDRDDWNCLSALGYDVAQGYFIAHSMPAAEIPQWIRAWRARQRELQRSA